MTSKLDNLNLQQNFELFHLEESRLPSKKRTLPTPLSLEPPAYESLEKYSKGRVLSRETQIPPRMKHYRRLNAPVANLSMETTESNRNSLGNLPNQTRECAIAKEGGSQWDGMDKILISDLETCKTEINRQFNQMFGMRS